MTRPARTQRAFTLLELSIVLTLIGVLLGTGLVMMTASIQATQYNATVKRMDDIEKALLNYAVANNRIPCPSGLTLLSTDANYGIEAANKGSCWGGTPAASFKAASNTVEGGVPTRALQLTDDYMYDGWGRRIRYAVDIAYTAANSLPTTAVCSPPTPNAAAISIKDASGTTARSTRAAYALISHGSNGHGAYTANGVTLTMGSLSTDKLRNCNCASTGVYTGTYTPTYVQKAPAYDAAHSGAPLYFFDDIVAYKEAWQLQAPNFPLTAGPASCTTFIYVADGIGNRVEKFDINGNYLSQLGACASGACGTGIGNTAFNTPVGVAVDSQGNLWVVDDGNARISEFSSNGTFIQKWTANAANGRGAISVDSSGKVWLLYGYGNSGPLDQYNGSGALQKSVSPVNINGFAIDSSGNIWLSDFTNKQLKQYASDGTTLLQTVGSSGTGNGQFTHPQQITIDSGGNIWVMDDATRVEEFSSSGTWMASLGGTASACSACLCTGPSTCPTSIGSGNGQLGGGAIGAGGMAFDPSGNIWVVDTRYSRVEEFDKNGNYIKQIPCSSGGCGWLSTSPGFGQNMPNYIAIGR